MEPEAREAEATPLAHRLWDYLWHLDMLRDRDRNRAFAAAISKLVPRKTVIDIGTGSGLLAMLAARAGSTGVVAYETVPQLAKLAQALVAHNRLPVVVVAAHTTESPPPESGGADVLVCELLDTALIGEGVLPSIRDACERGLLRPGYAAVPAQATVFAQVVESSLLQSWHGLTTFGRGGRLFAMPPSMRGCAGAPGIEAVHFSAITGAAAARPLTAPEPLLAFDFTALPPPGGRAVLKDVVVTASGTAHAVVLWWACDMSGDGSVEMSTAPAASRAEECGRDHWRQAVVLLPQAVQASWRALIDGYGQHRRPAGTL